MTVTEAGPSVAESAAPARSRGRLRALGRGLRTAVFVAAASLGLLGVLMAVAPAFGFQVVTLVTGSMAPAYPAGALVLVRDSAASAVRVGDVVTVSRSGDVPITHRVVGIAPSAGILPTRELTLRGDANDDDDPRPYVVERVGVVAGGVPWGGQLLQGLRSPAGLAALTVLIAGLVLWSWWPGGRADEEGEAS